MATCIVFSGGAAQAVVAGIQATFEALHDCRLQPTFGAVGTMRDRLVGGEPCDVVILTDALIAALAAQGQVVADSAAPLGAVATGIAVNRRSGVAPAAPPADGAMLRVWLERAAALYVPDLARSTAGRHIAGMLDRLGLRIQIGDRLREFPNGAAAMRSLATDDRDGALGITQVTEILFAPGVTLVGELPPAHALSTVYTAAVTKAAREPGLAASLVAALAAPSSHAIREAAGFRVVPGRP